MLAHFDDDGRQHQRHHAGQNYIEADMHIHHKPAQFLRRAHQAEQRQRQQRAEVNLLWAVVAALGDFDFPDRVAPDEHAPGDAQERLGGD